MSCLKFMFGLLFNLLICMLFVCCLCKGFGLEYNHYKTACVFFGYILYAIAQPSKDE